MARAGFDPHDIFERGTASDCDLRRVILEAVARRIRNFEISLDRSPYPAIRTLT
jgi:hypothetical protein